MSILDTIPERLAQAAVRRFGRDYDPSDPEHLAFAEGWQAAVDERWTNPDAAAHADLIDQARDVELRGGEHSALVVQLASALQQVEALMLARMRNLQALDDWGIDAHGAASWDLILQANHVDALRDEQDSLPALTTSAADIARDLRARSARTGAVPEVEAAIRWIEHGAVPISCYLGAKDQATKAEDDLAALRRSQSTITRRLAERAALLNLAWTGTLASAADHAERWMDHLEAERDDLRATIVELHAARTRGLAAIERILDQGPAPRTQAVRGAIPPNAPAFSWTDYDHEVHIALRDGHPANDLWLLDGDRVHGDHIRGLLHPGMLVHPLRWAP